LFAYNRGKDRCIKRRVHHKLIRRLRKEGGRGKKRKVFYTARAYPNSEKSKRGIPNDFFPEGKKKRNDKVSICGLRQNVSKVCTVRKKNRGEIAQVKRSKKSVVRVSGRGEGSNN